MKKIYTTALVSSLLFYGEEMFSQNIAINTTGVANTTLSMLEILQISATANTKGLHIAHSGAIAGTGYGVWSEVTGASTTNIAGYFSASGGTNNYPGIFMGGNVGIGTTAPTNKLHVISTNSAYDGVYANHQSTSTTAAYSAVNGQTNGAGYTATQGFLGYHNSSNKTFSVYGNGGDLAGMFNGIVGINSVSTALTTADLEIRNNTGANPVNVLLRQTTSNTLLNSVLGNFDFGDAYQTTAQGRIQVFRDAASSAPTDLPTAFSFWTIADGTTALTERMRITNAGNVGIGATAPGAKLEVAGQIKVTGGLPGLGKVLTSDAAGLATWQTPSGGGIGESVMYLRSYSGCCPSTTCPAGWTEAAYQYERTGSGYDNFVRTCYNTLPYQVMYLRSYSGCCPSTTCPAGWTEAAYQYERTGSGYDNFVRTCYK